MNTPTRGVCCGGADAPLPSRSLIGSCVLMALLLLSGAGLQAATVLWRAPNTTVHLDLPFASLEFENPLAGTETVLGHAVAQWLDADYTPGLPPGYDDWVVNPQVDGNPNEIWLRATGHVAQTQIDFPTDLVSIHLLGDGNDGVAAIYVDGALVARLNMNHPFAAAQTAVVLVRDLPVTSHKVLVRDESVPGPDDVAILGAAALQSDFKWTQPPVLTEVKDVFNGWNEMSVTNFPPLAADDWVCTSPHPVTRIRWWGSFANWLSNTPPPFLPNAFQITFWTDKPADPADPESFSHPALAIWQTHCLNFTARFAGYDYDPRTGHYESCFLFEQDLLPHEWFYQEPGASGTNIYWISIAGEYWQGPVGPWPWGWKTRPRNPASAAPDDAVRILAPPPWVIVPGMEFIGGEPIYYPDRQHSWDLAFELISDFEGAEAKWEQWPDLSPLGMDVKDSTDPPLPTLLADDFLCVNPGPITNITIWGSWLRDNAPDGGAGVIFTLSLHADIPAGPTQHSMPGPTLWLREFPPGAFAVSVLASNLTEGWFEPPGNFLPQGDTVCYQYDFSIPALEAFIQEGTPGKPVVYWLDCQARVPQAPEFQFGWKTSVTNWNDAATWVNAIEPYMGPWERLVWMQERPLDLAFRINSAPQSVQEVKWSQRPHPLQEGVNNFNGWNEPSILQSAQIVADDWVCADLRPISDIHWWGSFVGWQIPSPPETAFSLPSAFQFTIWTDVPPQAGGLNWSHPGRVLWQCTTTNYAMTFVGWDWDPRHPAAGPEACFKFHADLRPEEWFYQEPGQRTNIYWVSIAAVYPPQGMIEYPWGWKTRPRDPASPAPDDAVRINAPTAPALGELFQQGAPIEFPTGVSWDMAFELTAGPEPPTTDWGDAPRPYPTLAANNGAVHTIVAGLFMGARVDSEGDGQPDPNALGDDNNPLIGVDDEDGVSLGLPFFAGQSASVAVQASAANLILNAWYDFGADGSWAEAGDQIFTNVALAAGPNALVFQVPGTAVPTSSFARFRVSTAPNLTFTGPAPDGEVEDHEVRIVELDFGDAPDPGYPTLLANNGARHIVGPMFLGARVDAELDGQPSLQADRDDLNPPAGPDDEDGVVFHTALIGGVPNTITVTASAPGYLQAWLDLNGDGDWADTNEHVIVDRPLLAGANAVSFLVPSFKPVGPRTLMRFRLSGVAGLGYAGLAPDGEVEDYLVNLESLKLLQRPEPGVQGVDVDNSRTPLADDFLCEQSGPITDFHLWGSFVGDTLPVGGPGNMTFTLFLYADVPKGVGGSYSHPGELLWSKVFAPGAFRAGRVFTQIEGEWWHNPETGLWRPAADTQIYQFDFYVDREEAYHQVEGTIYWLGVKYTEGPNDGFTFGWKTTYEPWNDDACWLDTKVQPSLWRELRYGDGHPWAQLPDNSLNLAFAVSGEPAAAIDFGDAPDPAYPTLLANDGARHTVVPGLLLGQLVDAEANGQPNAAATGDDNNPPAGVDDEDGVVLPVLTPGQFAVAQVTVAGAGALNAWVDFGADGSWAEAGDQIFTNVALATGVHSLTFGVPPGAKWGARTFARFRFSTAQGLSYTGAAPDGEVEDHVVSIHPLPDSDLGDAPDSSNSAGAQMTAYPRGGPVGVIGLYPTVFLGPAPFGPFHANARAVFLGAAVSGEVEADILADEDIVNNLSPATNTPDLDAADDGLLPGVHLPHCGPGLIHLQLSWPPGPIVLPPMVVNVWCDWNRDGDWNDLLTCPDGSLAPEWTAQNIAVPPGVPMLPVVLQRCWHRSLDMEPLWIRVTLSETPVPGPLGWSGAGGDGPQGGFLFGETEDYYLTEYDYPLAFDFGDAPSIYPTLLAANGARHLAVPNFLLGRQLDTEGDGLPDAAALGDDQTGVADEDGIAFTSPILVNAQACVDVFLTGAAGGRLDGWLDFNKNGTWEPSEQIFNAQPLASGNNPGLCFPVPLQAFLGTNFARFRLSSGGGLAPVGAAQEGEVEDYSVLIRQRAPSTNALVTWIGVTNTTPSNQVIVLRWNAETNTHYEVRAAADMGATNGSGIAWQTISPIIIGPANQHTDTNASGAQRFYRVCAPWTYP